MTRFRARVLVAVVAVTVAGLLCVPTAAAPARAKPVLVVPNGWVRSADGKVVAQARADLTAKVPSGPRARLAITGRHRSVRLGRALNTATLTKQLTALAGADPALVDGPTVVTVGSSKAVEITFSETVGGVRLVRRSLSGTVAGTTWSVVLEAPETAWAGAVDTLMTIPRA